MKIMVANLTTHQGLPLALILRHYGGHSVVGYGLDPDLDRRLQELHGSREVVFPEKEMRELIAAGPIPSTNSMKVALREGHNLAIVACSPVYVPMMLGALSGLADTPVWLVTPLTEIGLAETRALPFEGSLAHTPLGESQTAAWDILGWWGIELQPMFGDAAQVRNAVEAAWRSVNNTIPVLINEEASSTGLPAPS